MSSEEYRGAKALFEVFDENKGMIPRNRIGSILVKMGIDPTEDDIKESEREFDQNGEGFIDFKEFAHMAQHVRRSSISRNYIAVHNFSGEEEQTYRAQFDKFDVDGSGTIDCDELGMMLEELNFTHDVTDLEPIVAEYDRNADGVLDFDEFVSLASRLKALQSGDSETAEHLRQQWLKKCSQNLLTKKRARQAAVTAAKHAFGKGKSIKEAIDTASSAAAATQAPLKDIQAATMYAQEKLQMWLTKESFDSTRKGNARHVLVCLNKGANPNWKQQDPFNNEMVTALMIACQKNKPDVAKVLATCKGADINTVSSVTKSSALHFAARNQDSACLQVLLEQGANVHAVAKPNEIPVLNVAAQFGSKKCCQLLIDAKAGLNVQDSTGETALMAAITKNQIACASFLTRLKRVMEGGHKIDLSVMDAQGHTAVDRVQILIRTQKDGASDSVLLGSIVEELDELLYTLRSHGGRSRVELLRKRVSQAEVEMKTEAAAVAAATTEGEQAQTQAKPQTKSPTAFEPRMGDGRAPIEDVKATAANSELGQLLKQHEEDKARKGSEDMLGAAEMQRRNSRDMAKHHTSRKLSASQSGVGMTRRSSRQLAASASETLERRLSGKPLLV